MSSGLITGKIEAVGQGKGRLHDLFADNNDHKFIGRGNVHHMKPKTFAMGIALLLVFASVVVYYVDSYHPLNLKISTFNGSPGYFQENFSVNTPHGDALYTIVRDSNSTNMSVGSYASSYGNLSTFMMLYVYKLRQNPQNPYSGISFYLKNATMVITHYGSPANSLPLTIGRISQTQKIEIYDFQNPLTVIKSKAFITIILRPSPKFLTQFEKENVTVSLNMGLSKIAEIGLIPVSAGNMNITYTAHFSMS